VLKGNAFKQSFIKRAGILFCSLFFVFLLYKAITPELPTPSSPIIFYANQSRQDLKLTLSAAIRSAQTSLFASFYGISDPNVISALSDRAKEGLDVCIEYDRSASPSLPKFFPASATITPKRCKGLMHRKILVVDRSYLFLGTANLTLSSLRHHSNCIIGLYAPPLAQFLVQPDARVLLFSVGSQDAEIWLLPDKEKQTLRRLVGLIRGASKTIRVAMFTFTHPEIAEALCHAVKRGVAVSILVDYYSARGASKKTIERLHKAGASLSLSQGPQLFHHKWAIIDQAFVLGSANWTKAAFTKNEDFLFILTSLTREQNRYLDQLWKTLELEANAFL
jgi:cardiolipin synthase A/B